MAADLTVDRATGRERTVREVVAEFAGLSSSAKQKTVTEAAGLSRQTIADLVEHGDLPLPAVAALLKAMQQVSRPLRPDALGILGEAALRTALEAAEVAPEGIRYKRIMGVTSTGLPYVIEAACGFPLETRQRDLLIGLNWSPALKHPFAELGGWLQEVPIDVFDPVGLILHVACPRLDFTDRGKGTLALPSDMAADLAKAIALVTKDWKQLKRQADKEHRVTARDVAHRARMQRRQLPSVKQAAWQVMEEAYQHASGNGLYPANARQIMYAARPLVLDLTDGKCWKDSNYFTQTLLPDFIEAHPDLTADWDVAFDARGHFVEPHTGHALGLGTLGVRDYVADWRAQLAAQVAPVALPTPSRRGGHTIGIRRRSLSKRRALTNSSPKLALPSAMIWP